MLLKIGIPTFSSAVTKKSAIKFYYWPSYVCPLPSKQGPFSPLYITCPFVISPLLLPQENHHIWVRWPRCFNNNKRLCTVQNVLNWATCTPVIYSVKGCGKKYSDPLLRSILGHISLCLRLRVKAKHTAKKTAALSEKTLQPRTGQVDREGSGMTGKREILPEARNWKKWLQVTI